MQVSIPLRYAKAVSQRDIPNQNAKTTPIIDKGLLGVYRFCDTGAYADLIKRGRQLEDHHVVNLAQQPYDLSLFRRKMQIGILIAYNCLDSRDRLPGPRRRSTMNRLHTGASSACEARAGSRPFIGLKSFPDARR